MALDAAVVFEPNRGQAPHAMQFIARQRGRLISIDGPATRLWSHEALLGTIEFKGAQQGVRARGETVLPGVTHYAFGRDASHWILDVPHYACVRLPNLYPRTDVIYRANALGSLEFDFVLAPGADPSHITLKAPMGRRLSADGNLQFGFAGLRKPTAWQEIDGRRQPIAVHYVLHGSQEVKLRLGPYNRKASLTIDPAVDFATFLGGSDNESDTHVVVGSDGSIYLAGTTYSADFPARLPDNSILDVPNNLRQPAIYLTKLKPDVSTAVWSLFVGGTASNFANSVDIDQQGNVYVLGTTNSTNVPLGHGAYKSEIDPSLTDLFVVKLDAATGHILAGTYLGTPQQLGGSGAVLRAGASGDIFVGGNLYPSPINQPGSFLLRLNTGLTSLVYRNNWSAGSVNVMQLDAGGDIVVGGNASGLTPVNPIPGIAQTPDGRAYIAKLSASGDKVLFASILGSNVFSGVMDLRLDSAGNIHVLGYTAGSALPQVNPLTLAPLPAGYPPPDDRNPSPFLLKVPPEGGALIQSTLLYGPEYTPEAGMVLSTNGKLALNGVQPCIAGIGRVPLQQTPGGLEGATQGYPYGSSLICVDETGSTFNLKTGLPPNTDLSTTYTDVAVTPDGAFLFAGTSDDTFPTTPGVVQPHFAGGNSNPNWPEHASYSDAFLLRVSLSNPTPRIQTVYPESLILDVAATGPLGFDLYGSGFGWGTQVLFNGQPVDSTFVSAQHISIPTVDVGMLKPGGNSITVSLPSPGGGTSNAGSVSAFVRSPENISLSPNSVPVGSGATSVSVYAANLSTSSVLRLNGQVRTAQLVSDSGARHLVLALQASELAQPGVFEVMVTNPPPGGGVSATAQFVVQASSGTRIPALDPPPSYFGFGGGNQLGPTLTFTGAGLDATTTAYWDGQAVSAHVTATTSIVIQPPVADLSRVAAHTLYVANGAFNSNTIAVLIGRTPGLAVAAADPSGKRLYGLQAQQDPRQAADFVIFDLSTGALLNTVSQVAASPALMAISADSSYVYIAAGSPPTLRRFNTATGGFDLQFAVAPPSNISAISITALATPPHSPQTIVVGINYDYPPGQGSEVRIFDDSQQRAFSSADVGITLSSGSLFATQNLVITGSLGCWTWLDYDASGISGGQGGCNSQPPGTIVDHGLSYVTDGMRVLPIAIAFDPAAIAYASPPIVAADPEHRKLYEFVTPEGELEQVDLDTWQQTIAAQLGPYSPELFLTPGGQLIAVTPEAILAPVLPGSESNPLNHTPSRVRRD
jgi:hypothetical protein